MANLGFTVDPNDMPEYEDGEFSVIPAGTKATMQFTKTDVIWKDAAGEKIADYRGAEKGRVSYEITILEGQYVNRKIWGGFNIMHPNESTEKWGKADFGKAWVITGTSPSDETDDLLYKPFVGTVKVGKDVHGEPSNDVNWRGSKSISEASSVQPARQQATRQAAPQPETPQRSGPWKNRSAA